MESRNRSHRGAKEHPRAGARVLVGLVLLAACSSPLRPTRSGPPGDYSYRPLVPHPLEETRHRGHAPGPSSEPEEKGEQPLYLLSLPTDFAPVQVGEQEFRAALVAQLVDTPMPVASRPVRLYPGRGGVLACGPEQGEAWQSPMAAAYERLCERRGTPGDCLTLFEDGPRLQDDDKRRIALSLAVGPALEGLDAEVRAMLSPQRLVATVCISIMAYMALLAVPDPVISKGLAAAATLLLWGYLGWELFDLIRAYVHLSEEAARATTFEQLREAGERFGRVIGPNSVRILVLVGTAAVGETAALMSRASRLPRVETASRNVEAASGLRLVEAATGTERLVFSVPEGAVRAVVPSQALAMTARGPQPSQGYRAFQSFDDFKKSMGKASDGNQWHHIVEQHTSNVARFGPEALHNTQNVIELDVNIHKRISAWYSTKPQGWSQTVREWLKTQSYEAQREYGLKMLRRFGGLP